MEYSSDYYSSVLHFCWDSTKSATTKKKWKIVVDIKIEGLTKAQEMALEDFLAKMQSCSDSKASRWIAFFADGGADLENISVTVNGNSPANCSIPANAQRWWHLYFKEDGDVYSPEPFYLAESSLIQQALDINKENN